MKKYILVILVLTILSCSKKGDEFIDILPKNEKIVPVQIILPNEEKKEVLSEEKVKSEIEGFSKKEIDTLINEGIDLNKFSKALEASEKGDKNSIITLIQIYEKLGFNEKYEKIRESAINFGIEEIIFPIVIKKISDSKYEEAKKLLAKAEDSKTKNEILSNIYFKEGIYLINNNNFQKAISSFKKSYELGSKDAALNIAYSYLNINDYENAKIWLKKSLKLKNSQASYELAVIYYNEKNYKEAIPYLIENYEKGKLELSVNIAVSYANLGDQDNAIIWLKKAKKAGFKEADKLIDEINSSRKDSYNVGDN